MTKEDLIRLYGHELSATLTDVDKSLLMEVAEHQVEAVSIYAKAYGTEEFESLDNFLDWFASLSRESLDG